MTQIKEIATGPLLYINIWASTEGEAVVVAIERGPDWAEMMATMR